MTGRGTQNISYVHRRWAAGPIWFGVLAAAGPTLERITLPSGIPVDELDPVIRPQDDLFRHVNGRWLARTEIPASPARRSSPGCKRFLRPGLAELASPAADSRGLAAATRAYTAATVDDLARTAGLA